MSEDERGGTVMADEAEKIDLLIKLRTLVRACESGKTAPMMQAEALSALCLCDELGNHLKAMASGTKYKAGSGGSGSEMRMALMKALRKNMSTLSALFKHADKDKSGTIDKAEFRRAIQATLDPKGDKYGAMQIDALFDEMDHDRSGQMSCAHARPVMCRAARLVVAVSTSLRDGQYALLTPRPSQRRHPPLAEQVREARQEYWEQHQRQGGSRSQLHGAGQAGGQDLWWAPPPCALTSAHQKPEQPSQPPYRPSITSKIWWLTSGAVRVARGVRWGALGGPPGCCSAVLLARGEMRPTSCCCTVACLLARVLT